MKTLLKLVLNVTLFKLTLRPKNRETEGDKEVLIRWPRGTVRECRHRACTKNSMSRMGTQAKAARRPAATGLLQLSTMLTYFYIIKLINKNNRRNIFKFVLPPRSVWFRYEAKWSGTVSHNYTIIMRFSNWSDRFNSLLLRPNWRSLQHLRSEVICRVSGTQ